MIGAIAAGGQNSRFGGQPKGLRYVGGRRIVDRVAEALRAVTSNLVLVTSASDASAWLPGVRVVPDGRPERGSLVGLDTALRDVGQPILLVAWDMPFLTDDLLRLVRDRSIGSTYATVPESGAGLEPFCAVYTPACLPWIDAALAAGDLSMARFVERLPGAVRVTLDDIASVGDPARLFFNVNSLADLDAAERLAGPA